jgi:hypothetical protein
MATIIQDQTRLVPTWLAAARHLEHCPDRQDFNVLLEIQNPSLITVEDKVVMDKVDVALREYDKS